MSDHQSTDLQRIVQLAELMTRQAERVSQLTEELRVAKDALRTTETEDLPMLMSELGLQEITLEDGAKVKVKPEVDCAITEANRDAAHAWLVERGYGGLIKSEVRRSYDREELEAAHAAAEQIGGYVVELVHPATLKSFIKERRAAGENVPEDLFSLRPYDKATLTRPRK